MVLQVEGKKGLDVIKKRIALRGPVAIYDGALAFAGGSFMGHYPWQVLGCNVIHPSFLLKIRVM